RRRRQAESKREAVGAYQDCNARRFRLGLRGDTVASGTTRSMRLVIALALFSLRSLCGADWKPAESPLTTPWTAQVDPGHALPEYPRPQMARQDWINLNGLWDYAIRPQQDTT